MGDLSLEKVSETYLDVLKEIYDNFKNEVNEAEENHENEKNV